MTSTSADTTRRFLPSRRALAACLVALLVVLAGCSGILGGGGTDSPATDDANDANDANGETGAGGTDTAGGTAGDGSAGDVTPGGNASAGGTGGDGGSDAGDSGGGTSGGTDTGGVGDGSGVSPGNDSAASNVTSLRLAHMSPDAPALDLYIDNQTVLEGISIGQLSSYTQIDPGTHHVRIADADNPDSVAFEQNQTFEAGTQTIKMLGEWTESGEAHAAPYLLADNDTPAGPNTAKVRLVHASPDAPTIDVTTAGSGRVLFDNVSFEQSTDYVTLSPGEYTLEIREETEGNDGDVLTTTNISVGGGGVYTAFVAGYLTPDDEPADMGFQLIGSVDNQPGNDDATATNDSGG